MARRRYNLSVLIGCLVLSTALWGYVTLTRTAEDDIEVPLLVTAPVNQAMLSTVPRTLTVRVRGTGLQILNMKYLNKTSQTLIDLGKVRSPNNSIYEIERDDLVRSTSLPSAVSIVSVTPSALVLTTGDLFRKSVPMTFVSNLSCRDGFEVVGSPVIDPATVEVRGTRSIVEDLPMWRTQKVSLDDVHEPLDITVPVSDSLATVLNVVPSFVNVRLDVQQTAEVVIRDVSVRVASDDAALRVEPSRVNITVQGGAKVLADLTQEQFGAMVAVTTLGPATPAVLSPDGVRVIGIEPAYVRLVRRNK